ncbi:transposase [Streptomyces niveus]
MTCPSGTAPGPHCFPASAGGPWTERSSGCSEPPRPGRTPPGTSTASCRSIPPSPAPTSTPPGHEKEAPQPRTRTPRGGLTSKIHLTHDAAGRPLTSTATGGNTNDHAQFTAVMDAIRMPPLSPGTAHDDKGYSSKAIRASLRRRGAGHTIPERADQTRNRLRPTTAANDHRPSTSTSTSSATRSNAVSTA